MQKEKKPKKNKKERDKKSYVSEANPFKDAPTNNTPINENRIEIFNPEDLFNNEGGSSDTTVIKELFNPKNPKVKSDLTETEINIMSRLFILSKKIYEPRGTYVLKDTLDQLVLLRISKDRQSRKEFVEANKEAKKNTGLNVFDKIIGGTQ